MNRLWVRFSLVIGGVVLLVLLSPALLRGARVLLTGSDPSRLRETVPAVAEALPAETLTQLQIAIVEETARTVTSLAIVGAAAALGFGILLSRGLIAPLRNLEKAAQAIEAQDLSYRVKVEGSTEFVAVTTAFNQMAAQLEEAEIVRRNLLADVAHELRNPLHVLQGNLQAILDDVYPLSLEEIARLADQTRYLTRLVDDLHELAQAEAHRLPLNKHPAEIAVIVKDTVETFRPLAAAREVHLQVALQGTMPQLTVDAARIRQMVANLLTNDLQHTPAGGQILVTVDRRPEDLTMTVEDNGEGIDPAYLPHVFERFYRTDEARSRETGGTGLGLAIVRAIVEAHEGTISVASAGIDRGSSFTVTLPLT